MATGHKGEVQEPHHEKSISEPQHLVPVIVTEAEVHGVWRAANRSSAGTTIVVQPPQDGSVSITDILVSSDQAGTSSVKLQFTDGTDTEVIATFDSTNGPVGLAHPVRGRMQGWKNARIELVTTGNVDAYVTIGYLRSPDGITYALWDQKR
jgi:hypothetical protein